MIIWRFIASPLLAACACLVSIAAAQAGSSTLLGTGNGVAGFLPAASCSGNFVVSNYSKHSNDFNPADGFWATATDTTAITGSTVTGQILPDGTTGSVTQINIPAFSAGTTNYSVIQYTDGASDFGQFALAHGVWAKVVSGTGVPYTSISHSTTFWSNPITNDGAWHQVVNTSVPIGLLSDSVQIGINQFDTAQQAGNAALTVYLTGDYWVGGQYSEAINNSSNPYAYFKTGGSLASTGTVPVNAQITGVPCPLHTAQRDPSTFTPYPGNPIVSESPTEPWRSGGVSNPYIQSQFSSGGFYWAFMNCTGVSETFWMSYCLMKTPVTDGLNWTEDTTNAPYLQTFGSIMAQPTISSVGSGFTAGTGTGTWTGGGCGVSPVIAITAAGSTLSGSTLTPSPNNGVGTGACPFANWPTGANTTWSYSGLGAGTGASFTFASVKGTGAAPHPSWWQLHPAFLPFGCSDGTNPHPDCILYSAVNGTTQNVYLAWAATVNGVYTPYGCPTAVGAGAGMCSTAVPIILATLPGSTFNPGLVSVINVGGSTGTNYIYLATGSVYYVGNNFSVFTTPANSATTTSGNTLSYKTNTSFTLSSGLDWYSPNSSTGIEDPHIFLNHCGFYELNYTAYNGTSPGAPFTNSSQQIISEAVTDLNGMENGTWWQYPAVIVPTNSSLYGGQPSLGDLAPIEINGTYILTMNYDNGTNQSRAMALTGPQGACP